MAKYNRTLISGEESNSQISYSPTISYATYYGTNNGDTIYTSAISVYYGTIQAGGGNDLIYVGYTLAGDVYNGAYNIYGGDGIDGVNYSLFGQQSGHGVNISLRDVEGQQWGGKYIDVEYVSATQYNDILSARNGDSATLYGLGGNDTLIGGAAKCLLDGGSGNDVIYGGKGSDKILGGDGDDLVYGGSDGSDYIDGGSGNDVIYSGKSSDKILGGDGDDLVYGGNGSDYMDGGSGNNTLYLLAGTSTDGTLLYGLNIFSYGTYGVVNSSSPNWSQSLYYNFKIVHGSVAGDGYVGGINKDIFYGEGGNDNIWGGDGADYLSGGAGSDRIWGENGNDTIWGGNGADYLFGGAGSDYMWGESGNDIIGGGDGNDWISGGQGVNTITGGSGADKIEILCKSSYNTITDFQIGKGGDVLTIGDLLQMTNFGSGKDINQFLKFTQDNAGHAVLNVNIDAAHTVDTGLNVGWNQIATLSNITGTLNLNNMLSDGNILV